MSVTVGELALAHCQLIDDLVDGFGVRVRLDPYYCVGSGAQGPQYHGSAVERGAVDRCGRAHEGSCCGRAS